MNQYNDTTFQQDFQQGKQAEIEFIEVMKRNYPDFTEFQLNNSTSLTELRKYDVSFKNSKGIIRTQEIKSDLRSQKTGNFQLEIQYKGKPSGLMSTEAELFVIKSSDSFYMFRTITLKELLEQHNWKQVTINNGTAICVLVPIVDLKPYAINILTI